ncbi:MAG TPA: aminopeptidase P family protein [Bacteroidales bacterium]|nr:aminopeptidase P family protein [Bacteroidales bacterium]
MFPAEVCKKRRQKLKELLPEGVILFPGNREVPYNYPANTYRFRQDSSFSYFFGLNEPDLAGIIDPENEREILFGNDVNLEDIIWMGPQPLLKEKAAAVGINETLNLSAFQDFIQKTLQAKRKIHYLPPYRSEILLFLHNIMGISPGEVVAGASTDLVKAVVSLRSIKDAYEIAEIEKMVNVAREMHITVMRLAKPGRKEAEIAGIIEGIALASGGASAYPVILSKHGEILHNHSHANILKAGDLLVTDAGAESELLYASDITRTVPVGGKFSARQKEIYEIVLAAENNTIDRIKPGKPHLEVHLAAARDIAHGLKETGLMKGDVDEAVRAGAHALFFPHGLGHMLGMDVHDMEGLGEEFVGYDEETKRIQQFGTAYLRLGKKLRPGFVLTDEPGIYFIPALIDSWYSERKFEQFINYPRVLEYKDFGGIRIEDNLLVTETGCRVLGNPIPKTVIEIEEACRS